MDVPHYRNVVMDSTRWQRVALRDDDIIVSTPPKCGTTWMQTCCALLLFRTPELPAPMSELSPWVDMLTWPMDELVSTIEAQRHRRFLKTHTPLDGLPWNPSVTYICVGRDPRDVALSWDNHVAATDIDNLLNARIAAVGMDDLAELFPDGPPAPPSEDPEERFWQWIESDPDAMLDTMVGLANLAHHIATFWERKDEPNVHLFHYAEMKADLPVQLRRLAGILAIDIDDDELARLVDAASFESMKSRADMLAPDTTHKIWQDNARFFDRARSGGWHDIPDADGPRYHDRISALASADVIAWLHT